MRKLAIVPAMVAILALPACEDTQQNETLAAAGFGAAFGAVTASIFGADDGWTVVAALAGAAAGTLIAENSRNNECAYSDGRGGYYTAPC